MYDTVFFPISIQIDSILCSIIEIVLRVSYGRVTRFYCFYSIKH